METYKVGALHGDGIGPEITHSAIEILRAAALKAEAQIEFITLPMGFDGIEHYGDPLPQFTKDELSKLHGWIMGPHDSAAYPNEYKGSRNPSGELRHYFDLFTNIRPARNIAGIRGVVNDTDLVIIRENTEGFYCDRNMYIGVGEYQVTEDVVISTGVFTRKAAERIANVAFKMAMQRRKKVTIVHKANVIKLGTGLYLNVCREVAKQYPEVQVNDFHIDAMTAHLVRHAKDFDVIVTENMFGDILSDLTGELVGSLGLAPSINTNDKLAMAQAAHGSAPDIAGQNIANPTGIILSTAMLMKWLSNRYSDNKLNSVAQLMEAAVFKTISDGVKTRDLNGSVSTTEFTFAVISNI